MLWHSELFPFDAVSAEKFYLWVTYGVLRITWSGCLYTYTQLWWHCALPQRNYKVPETPVSRRCTWTRRLEKRQDPPLHLCAACVKINTYKWKKLLHCHRCRLRASSNVLMIRQQLGTGDCKDSDHARAETTGEDLLPRMEGYWAGAVFRYKIIQLNTRQEKHRSDQ